MLPGRVRRDPAPGGAGQQPKPDEEGFGDLLDGLALLADGDRQRAEPDRPAAEAAAQNIEDGPVEAVEAGAVHLVEVQRPSGDVEAAGPVAADLCVVADPSQEP